MHSLYNSDSWPLFRGGQRSPTVTVYVYKNGIQIGHIMILYMCMYVCVSQSIIN